MGFRFWVPGLMMILGFLVLIAAPCAIVAVWGSKMVNDLGNNPSKSATIQLSVWWVYLVEFFFLILLVGYGALLYNLNVS